MVLEFIQPIIIIIVEGLQFRSMDPSHIALIDISCPAVAFEKYECPSQVKFGFRVDDFAKSKEPALVIQLN